MNEIFFNAQIYKTRKGIIKIIDERQDKIDWIKSTAKLIEKIRTISTSDLLKETTSKKHPDLVNITWPNGGRELPQLLNGIMHFKEPGSAQQTEVIHPFAAILIDKFLENEIWEISNQVGTESPMTKEAVERLKVFIDEIKVRANDEISIKEKNSLNRKVNKNISAAKKFLKKIFLCDNMIGAICIELSHDIKNQDKKKSAADEFLKQKEKFLNALRKNQQNYGVTGYWWKLEGGRDSKYSLKLFLFIDGKTKPRYITNSIINLWRQDNAFTRQHACYGVQLKLGQSGIISDDPMIDDNEIITSVDLVETHMMMSIRLDKYIRPNLGKKRSIGHSYIQIE